MLEYGSVTGLPDKYRITLAISVALLLHTLIMATLPYTAPSAESHRQTVKVELVSPGSIPLPESAASATSPTRTTAPDRNTITTEPTSTSDQRDPVAVESPQVDTSHPRHKEPTARSAPSPQTPVVEPQSPARTTPSQDSAATAAGNPEQPVEDTPEKVTRITSSPRDVDPYTASLAVHIGKELGKRPVPSSRSVTEPVSSQLELKLLPSGALTGAKVTKSTGFNDIDRAIYQAALLASPYPKPPEEYSGRKQFRVELIFAPERL
jgi:protein TonB